MAGCLMDIRQLRSFIRVVEQASISRAAQSLHMAQPSLSQRIRELEREVGVALLQRHSGGVRPTEAGAMVADRARAILRLVDTMVSEAQSAGREPVGQVIVGLPTTMALHLTLPLVQLVQKLYPKIRLRVSEGMSGHVQEWVHSGRLDIAVLYTADPVPGLALEELVKEDLCLVSAHDPALAGQDIRNAELVEYPLVLPSPDHGLRRSIEAGWRRVDRPLDVVAEIDSLVHLKRLAMDSGLHTILPAAACRDEVLAGKLMCRRVLDPPLRRPIAMATSTSRPLSVAGQHIYGIVKGMVRDAVRA
ncbi:MAG: LysR family transcriptional regulator [Rhabdaerophilum sp.]